MNPTHCPRCHSQLKPTVSINNSPSTDWLECTSKTCNTYVDTYKPMPHQTAVHRDNHRVIGNFGSFGTGKTKTSEKEIEKHILITPNANILLGANITSQYEQTLLRDFEMSFPKAFMQGRNLQKAYIDFINGARLMMRPFYDPDNLRSNSYSLAVSLEASESSAESFHTVKNRLRNMAASTTDLTTNQVYDWRKFIVESNPDSGYIRSDVLLVSETITRHGRFLDEEYYQDPDAIDKNTSSHAASTDVNVYLPEDYYEVNAANKPAWWIKRFLHGSFLFAEGLVYPNFQQRIVPTPPNAHPDPNWKIIIAHDYGLVDKATFVFGGVDQDRGMLIIYKVVETDNLSVQELANLFKQETRDINFGQLYTTPLIDPKSNKRDFDKKDLITHYQEYGITFKPGYVNVEARVFRLSDYIEQGRIEVWDCCKPLIEEMKEYKFKEQNLNSPIKNNKPVDKDNHSINALEWITMELPANPKYLYLNSLDEFGRDIEEKIKKFNSGGWQLADDTQPQQQDYDQAPAFGINLR